jgi:hypothetical protein
LLEDEPLLGLFMSASLTEMYSDNFDQVDEDPREEFVTELTFGTTYRLQNPHSFVSLANTFSVNYEYNAEVTNIGFANLDLSAAYNLSRLTLGLSESFIIDDDRDEISTTGTLRERSRFLRNSVTPQLQYALDRWTSGTLKYTNIIVLEEDEDQDDSITHVVTVGLDRRLTRDLEGNLSYIFTYDDDEASEPSQSHTVTSGLGYALTRTLTFTLETLWTFTDRGGEESDALFYGGTVGIRYRILPSFGLFFAIGPAVFDDNTGNPSIFANWEAGVDGSLRLSPSTTLSLVSTQNITNTAGEVDNVGIVLNQTLNIRLEQILLPALRLELFADLTRTDFLEDLNTEGLARNDEELFISAGTRLSYTMTRLWLLSLEYQHRRRDTNTSADEFVENNVLFTLSRKFPGL